MTIVWNTDVATDGEVNYGDTPGLGTTVTDPAGSGTVHVVTLTNLQTDTIYHYEVRGGGAALSPKLSFRTFPANGFSGPFTIAGWGDCGTGGQDQADVNDRIELIDPDLGLLAGDIVYSNGEAEFFDPKLFQPYADLFATRNLYTVLGNHDVGTANGQPYIDALYLPSNNPQNTERYYSFDYGNVHIIGLDTTQSFDVGSPQHDWLAQDLATQGGFWTIVYHHHTPYTTSTTHANSPEGAAIRVHLGPLFDLYEVDIDFAGHTHAFERTYPTFGDSVVGSSVAQEPDYVDPGGTIYITSGGGGRGLYNHDTEHPNNDYLVCFIKELHATTFEFNGNTITTNMVERDGTIRDTFTLTKTPDTADPQISSVVAVNVEQTQATIIWDTDELADSHVEYGIIPNFGNEKADALRVTAHSVLLTGLTAGVEYQFRVTSMDRSGNSSTTGTMTFSTGGDLTPPVMSNVKAIDVSETSATITWDTDEPADSVVDFGVVPQFEASRSDAALVMSHSVILDQLQPGLEYQYRAQSRDPSDNVSNSAILTFFTVLDSVPPVISDLQAQDVQQRQARITWSTDEPGTSLVEYGMSMSNLNRMVSSTDLVTTHSQDLDNLAPNSTYYYQVTSEDEVGNESTSELMSFVTSADVTGPVILNVAAVDVGDTEARITWETDEPSDSLVEYGISGEFGQQEIGATVVTSHSVSLTGIFPGLEYFYQVISEDEFGNTTIGPTLTFVTTGDALDPHTVAYWRLDDNLDDEAAGARHGVASPTPVFSTDVPAPTVAQTGATNARSYSLDGTNYVTFPDLPLNLVDGDSSTIECFFRASELATNQVLLYQGVATGDGFGPENSLQVYVTGAASVGVLEFQAGSPNIFILSSPGSITANSWHHIALTLDQGMAELYLDGVLVGSDDYNAIDKTGWSRDLWLGRSPVLGAQADGFTGEIDELRVANTPIGTGQFLSTQRLFRFELDSPASVERTDPLSVSLIGTSTSKVLGFACQLSYDTDVVDYVGNSGDVVASTIWADAESIQLSVDSAAGLIDLAVLREAVGPADKPPLGPFDEQLFAQFHFSSRACTGDASFGFGTSGSDPNVITVEDFGAVDELPSVEANVTSLQANETFVRGDANGSMPIDPSDPTAVITIADGMFLLTAFYLGGAQPPCLEAADVNADGRMNLVDAIYLLQYLFGNQNTDVIPAPWPDVGRAPTPNFSCDDPPSSDCAP